MISVVILVLNSSLVISANSVKPKVTLEDFLLCSLMKSKFSENTLNLYSSSTPLEFLLNLVFQA